MNPHLCILTALSLASASVLLADSLPRPKTAEITNIPAKYSKQGIKAGDVKVTYTDGHSEMTTHSGNCTDARVTAGGVVSWTHFSSLDLKSSALDEVLHLRFLNGSTKVFKPYHEAPFIQNWELQDNGHTLVIESRQHHGPPYYIKYDVQNGRTLGTVTHYLPYDQLPAWARPLSDEKP